MSDVAAALADTTHLSDFEGVPVLRTRVAITQAGDGLSQALAVAPAELPIGSTVYVVLECRVQALKHEPTNKDDPREGLARVHVLRAGRATMVDRGAVESALDTQAEAIRLANEKAAGIARLSTDSDAPFGRTDDDEDEDDEEADGDAVTDAADLRQARARRRRQ